MPQATAIKMIRINDPTDCVKQNKMLRYCQPAFSPEYILSPLSYTAVREHEFKFAFTTASSEWQK